MKKEATLKRKRLKTNTSDEKRGNPKKEANFAKLTLEGDGDAFQFRFQSHTKATHQTKKTKNHQLTEASYAKLTLDGEGDAF
jgi:hypothetical protein